MSDPQVTSLLSAVARGDPTAEARLVPLVYEELWKIANALLRERRRHTLQSTALVHEAYVKLLGGPAGRYRDRRHFYRVAARAMRQVLADHARRRSAGKRGSGRAAAAITLSGIALERGGREVDVLSLDEALTRLSALSDRQGRIVELRFFGGLTIEAIAEVLDISATTVKDEWRGARAWLRRELAASFEER